MSMLSINTAASLPRVSTARQGFMRFSGFTNFFTALIDVFAEAQEMARAAHKRYPFALEG